MENSERYRFKFILVGEAGVGKGAIITQLIE